MRSGGRVAETHRAGKFCSLNWPVGFLAGLGLPANFLPPLGFREAAGPFWKSDLSGLSGLS